MMPRFAQITQYRDELVALDVNGALWRIYFNAHTGKWTYDRITAERKV